jgi:hypothetical protein
MTAADWAEARNDIVLGAIAVVAGVLFGSAVVRSHARDLRATQAAEVQRQAERHELLDAIRGRTVPK